MGAAEWLRNNYQDHANIADLCEAMISAAPPSSDQPTVDELKRRLTDMCREYQALSVKLDQTWNEAIEAAVAICDAQATVVTIGGEGEYNDGRSMAATVCASMIRVLARKSQAQEPSKPVSSAAGAALPFAISPEEMKALRRFHECATDGEGYDVPKEMMRSLAEIGLLRHVTANYYEHTAFGLAVLNRDFSTSQLPASGTVDEREAFVASQRRPSPSRARQGR